MKGQDCPERSVPKTELRFSTKFIRHRSAACQLMAIVNDSTNFIESAKHVLKGSL